MHNIKKDIKKTKMLKTDSWQIIIDSMGTAGASILKPLSLLSPLRGPKLADLVYQAPSILADNLPRKKADELVIILRKAGLDVRVADNNEKISVGKKEFETALAIKKPESMTAVAASVSDMLGIKMDQASKMICASPAALLGSISANTVVALKKTFEPLGALLDVSRMDEAIYDVFVGDCSEYDRTRIEQALGYCGIHAIKHGKKEIIAQGLNKEKAEVLWQKIGRTALPAKIVNRDFQRFDLILESASQNREMIDLLVASTGMSEKIAYKVIKKLPVILHQNISFLQAAKYMEDLSRLGAEASGHLLAFKTFSLDIVKSESPDSAVPFLQSIGGMGKIESSNILKSCKRAEGPFTAAQGRWLQWELKCVGTKTRMVER